MNSLEIGDLVHVPASVPLEQFDAQTTPPTPTRRLITRVPELGLVMSSEQNGYREIYWRGERWAVNERSLFKIKEDIK